MADIYRSADTVLVWLGAASDSDLLIYETFLHLTQAKQDDQQVVRDFLSDPITIPGSDIDEKARKFATALTDALNKPYFGRLWPLQELYLGRNATFHAGSFRMAANVWYRALELIFHTQMPLAQVDNPVLLALDALRKPVRRHFDVYSASRHDQFVLPDTALLRCFRISAHLKCSEPRDRIYGIRAIAGIENVESLVPDYRLDVLTLYKRCALSIIFRRDAKISTDSGHRRCSVTLALAGTQEVLTISDQRPSWVPDFGDLTRCSTEKLRTYEQERWLEENFAGGSTHRFSHSCVWCEDEPAVLNVSGHSMATIRCVAPVSTTPPDARIQGDMIEYYKTEVFPWVLACVEFIVEQDFIPTEAWKIARLVLQGNRIGGQLDTEFEDKIRAESIEYLSQHLETSISELPDVIVDLWTEIMLHKAALDSVELQFGTLLDHSQRLAVRHLASVPRTSMIGDELCLIQGAPTPLVFRKAAQERYLVVGDAWVDQFFDGEAWDEAERQGTRTQFSIV